MRANRDGSAAWYVLEAKRYRERQAAAALREKGVVAYVPMVLQWPPPAVGNPVQPMFPGYVLVCVMLPDDSYRVTWTNGVKRWVTFGETPPSLEAGAVEFLQSCEGPDGIIRCGEPFKESQEVRIIRGPFRGLTAIVAERLPARERVRVLMDILQRQTTIELPERWIARV